MPVVTVTQLENASTDANNLDLAVNSSEHNFVDRNGRTRLTYDGIINAIAAITSRGNWAAATAYAVRDVVRFDNTWYICVESHTSSASFATDLNLRWSVHQIPDAGAPEVVIATAGMTEVFFTTFRFTPGNGSLHLDLEGFTLGNTAYTERSDGLGVVMAEPLAAGYRLTARRGALANPNSAVAAVAASVGTAGASATAAQLSATQAAASQVAALAAAAYKGQWSTLTGALNVPSTVYHLGVFWVLLANLANVTTSEPGVSNNWVPLVYPAGTEPDQCPRNRDLGTGAYQDRTIINSTPIAGVATGVVAGSPQSVLVAVPGMRADDYVLGVSLSIYLPANMQIFATAQADNTVRVNYVSHSGTITLGAHTVYVRVEKRLAD